MAHSPTMVRREKLEATRRILHWWLLMLVAVCGVWSCRTAESTPAGQPPFNIVLVVLDACRADKFGCYGFDRSTTPRIDALANDPDAVIFRNHHAEGTWTRPSIASLFSGLFVHQHGVTLLYETPPAGPARRFRTNTLAPQVDTMAERLHALGFTTFAVVTNHVMASDNGYAQGFGEYIGPDAIHGDGRKAVRDFAALARAARGRFFGYLHLMACHVPLPPPQRDPEYMERYGFAYDEAARRAAGIDFTTVAINDAVNRRGLVLDPPDVRFLHLIYEAKLRGVDRNQVGPFVQALREMGHYDDSLIVLTADHGEQLYDHHGYAHRDSLWEEILHVPLVVKFPKGHKPAALGREVTTLSGSVDLLPSLLSLAGGPTSEPFPGKPILQGQGRGYAFAEMGHTPSWALLLGSYKLIETPRGPLLFDLRTDPGEQLNIAATLPNQVATMRGLANTLTHAPAEGQAQGAAVERDLEPKVIERLRQLGYIDQPQ